MRQPAYQPAPTQPSRPVYLGHWLAGENVVVVARQALVQSEQPRAIHA